MRLYACQCVCVCGVCVRVLKPLIHMTSTFNLCFIVSWNEMIDSKQVKERKQTNKHNQNQEAVQTLQTLDKRSPPREKTQKWRKEGGGVTHTQFTPMHALDEFNEV